MSIRIMVLLIANLSGWPSAPLTDLMLKPPWKVRLSRIARIESKRMPSPSPLPFDQASRDTTVAAVRLSEPGVNRFWSSCSHR